MSVIASETEIFTYKCSCGKVLKIKVSEGDFSEQESTALEDNGWRFRGGKYHCSGCADAVPDTIEDLYEQADSQRSCL